MKGKHLLIGVAGLAIIAAIVISLDDTFPPEFARGTIGVADTVVSGVEAASRYRTEQINAGDVQLGDTEVQKLLQNDQFIALIQNPNFAKAIEAFNDLEKALEDEADNKAIQGPDGGSSDVPDGSVHMDALEDQKIMAAIQNDESRSALWDDDVKRLIVSPLWEAMIKDQSVRDYIGSVAVRDSDMPEENKFKAEEGGELPEENKFKAEEGGELPQDNKFKALEGGDTPQDNQFKALEGGDTPQENNFEAVADDVREVLESQNFKQAVQDHPGFWRQVSEDPGFAKAIQDNYEALDAFSKVPEPTFAKAIEAIGEGLEVIQGSESVIGDLAKTPAPVFNLVAQDPAFEALLGGVAVGNDR